MSVNSPKAAFGSSVYTGQSGVPLTVALTAHAVVGSLASWKVAWGDGSVNASGSGAPPSTLQHTYFPSTLTSTGNPKKTAFPTKTYAARLTVIDTFGNAGSGSTKITIQLVPAPPPTLYPLTVNSGNGSGNYLAGAVVTITASTLQGQAFSAWVGAVVADPSAASTTITMPAAATTVTATYVPTIPPPPPTFPLTVVSGTGSGSYTAGTVVAITAAAPPAGQFFSRWTGAAVADAFSASTTLVMPAAATVVTATYALIPPPPPPPTFALTVGSGTGSGNYPAGTVVSIVAATAPLGYAFSQWTGAVVADPLSASTTLVMPAANTSVTATYVLLPPPPPPPPPVFVYAPAPIVVASPNGLPVVVTFPDPTTSGGVPPIAVTFQPPSGSSFAVGVTTVTVLATDAIGQTSSATFTVTVTAPPNPLLVVICPGNQSANSPSGTPVVVTYPPASTTGGLAPVTITYSQASGTLFGVRQTIVTVTARSADGQVATCSFTVTVTSTVVGAKRILAMTDLTWLGTFKSPDYLAANGGGVTYPFFTLRRLGGVLKTLWLTADHGGYAPPNEFIQVDYPGYNAVLANAPLASANFRNFGNGWLAHAVGQDGRILNGLYASGITWDDHNNCVWVMYSDVYNTSGYKDPVFIRGDINDAAPDASAVTWSGPWRLSGTVLNSPAQADSHQTQSFLALIPPAYGTAHLGGATIALGGSYSSGGIASPFNNVLWAPTVTPTSSTPTQPNGGADLAATCLIGGDIGLSHRARRPGDYTTQFCVDPAGQGDTDPTSYTRGALTGYWTAFDSPGSCVWVDWDTIKGVLFFVVHGRGHIFYNNSGLHPPPPGHCAHGVVDRYFVTGPESVVRQGNDSYGVPEPPGDFGLAYGTGPDLEAALYAYDPETFVPVAGGSPWQVPVHDWAYCLDKFPSFAVSSAVGQKLVIKPNGMGIDQTSRLLMIPCGYVTGGTTSGYGFYVNVFAVAP